MVPTIVVHGSNGKVMAPIGGGQFIEGERKEIYITRVSDDGDVPLHIREAMVGLSLSSIFTSEQIKGAIPPGARAVYIQDVVDVLVEVGFPDEAGQLALLNRNQYDMLVFKEGEYELMMR